MYHKRDDLFTATIRSEMGFELGDFAKKGKKKPFLIWHIKDGGGSMEGVGGV